MTDKLFDPRIDEAARRAELMDRHDSIMDNRGLEGPTRAHKASGREALVAARAVLGIVTEPVSAVAPEPVHDLGPPPPMPPRSDR